MMYMYMYIHLHDMFMYCTLFSHDCCAVVEVVPHLNAVLSRMITQLGAIKHENMQWVFSYGQCILYMRYRETSQNIKIISTQDCYS